MENELLWDEDIQNFWNEFYNQPDKEETLYERKAVK